MQVKVTEKNTCAKLLSIILAKLRENLESLGARGRTGNQISSFKEYGKMGQNTGVSVWRWREALVSLSFLPVF